MNIEELETAVTQLPQSDFHNFANWFQRLLSKKNPDDSLDKMLSRVTDANLHAETNTGTEQGREQIAW